MMTYNFRGKEFFTICSVHNELDLIFKELINLKPEDYRTTKELYSKMLEIMKESIELVKIATDMGQRMENGLKIKKEYAPFSVTENFEFKETDEED